MKIFRLFFFFREKEKKRRKAKERQTERKRERVKVREKVSIRTCELEWVRSVRDLKASSAYGFSETLLYLSNLYTWLCIIDLNTQCVVFIIFGEREIYVFLSSHLLLRCVHCAYVRVCFSFIQPQCGWMLVCVIQGLRSRSRLSLSPKRQQQQKNAYIASRCDWYRRVGQMDCVWSGKNVMTMMMVIGEA